MAKSIRHASSLPQWFCLEKYDAAKQLDAAGWYEQLSVRRDMLELVGPPRWDHWKTNGFSEIRKQEAEILALLREAPIVDIARNLRLQVWFLGGALQELKMRDPCYSFGVHLTTVREHYRTENNIEDSKLTHARGVFEEMFSDEWTDFEKPYTPQKYKCEDWIDEPIDNIADSGLDVNLRVNMLLPDKVLIEQFRRVLNELRSSVQWRGIATESMRKPDFADWARFGVLPYLDLLMWQRESGIKIPNRVMADAIFPLGDGGEEVVRKTTAKLANELITRKHLETLAAIAAHEIAERNTA